MPNSTPPSPDPTTDKPPRPRRWIPVSLRMFVAMLVLLGLASVFWIGIPDYRQFLAIQKIERAGGWVTSGRRGPELLRRWLGDERMKVFDLPFKVEMGSSATDASMSEAASLSEVQVLWICSPSVTDVGLVHIEGLTSVRQVWIGSKRVTDAGLVHLKGLSNLESLTLDGTQVTDAGLVNLRELKGLRSLKLWGTRTTAAGIAELQQALPNLEIVK
jgi:hypothetical protein